MEDLTPGRQRLVEKLQRLGRDEYRRQYREVVSGATPSDSDSDNSIEEKP